MKCRYIFSVFGGVKFVWDSSGYALWMTWKVVNFDFYENIKLIDSVSSTEWLIGFEWDSSPVGSEWLFGSVWDSSPTALNDDLGLYEILRLSALNDSSGLHEIHRLRLWMTVLYFGLLCHSVARNGFIVNKKKVCWIITFYICRLSCLKKICVN